MAKMRCIPNPPSLIVKENCKFLIMDAPTDNNLNLYIDFLKEHEVQTLVRTCEPTYSSNDLEKAGINVVDIRFCDNKFPSRQVIEEWLNIVNKENMVNHRAVAIHCVAGLGRSPLLVAIGLMYFSKMSAIESVELIRSKRRGAINQNQFNCLKNFKPCCHDNCCIIL